jgi:ribosomal protein S18 acetylase RimI-like enzyme
MDTIQTKIIKTPISLELEKEIRELDMLCFPYHYKKSKLNDELDRFCSKKDLFAYVLVWSNEELIGEAAIYKRKLSYKNDLILLGGIGSVATHPKARKKGIARMMVSKAMDFLKNENCDVAYLCTDQNNQWLTGFYKSFGFRKIARYTYLGESGKRYIEDDGMISPICNHQLFKDLLFSNESFGIGKGNW